MLAWWLIIWSCFVVWLLNVLSRCRYVRSHVICVHFICSMKWKTSPRNVRFILMSSTELHIEFGIYFLLNFLFFDLTALTQTNIPVSVHNFNWCNCRSICFLHSILTSDSYFWPDLFLSLSFSQNAQKIHWTIHFFLLLQKFTIIRPTDRSYALVFFSFCLLCVRQWLF